VNDPLDELRRFEILAGLSDQELRLLETHLTPVTCKRGEYLFREGEPGDALYFLTDGILVAERLIDPEAGTAKDLAILPAFSVVGEMVIADDAPRSASVRAEINSRTLRLSSEAFDTVLTENPTVGMKVFRALFAEASKRLRATSEELVAVYEVGRLVAGAADTTMVGVSIVRNLMTRPHASYAVVALYDRESNGLRVVHAPGVERGDLTGTSIPLNTGLVARAYDDKKPLLVERLIGATEAWESSTMVLAPLIDRDASAGVLLVGAPESDTPYSVHSLSLVAAVANISARVLIDGFRLDR